MIAEYVLLQVLIYCQEQFPYNVSDIELRLRDAAMYYRCRPKRGDVRDVRP